MEKKITEHEKAFKSGYVAIAGAPNAGKSTLIKILGGIYRPDEGAVMIDGQVYAHEAGRAQGQKVAFIHQDLGLIEWMSVAENIALAVGYPRKGGLIDWTATEDVARKAMAIAADICVYTNGNLTIERIKPQAST